jgi:sodium pump decarboxylase gamma subunit
MTLLDKFANPDMIKTLSMGDKLTASFMVTILGMAITFAVLMLLWGLIVTMTNMLVKEEKKEVVTVAPKAASEPVLEPACAEENDEELVAVITAAIAASLNTSTHNLVVRNIVRVVDETPAWGQAGRAEQLGNRL